MARKAEKVQKAKDDILKTLDESVQGLRDEISVRIEAALASPTPPRIQYPGREQQQLQPAVPHNYDITARARALQRASRSFSLQHHGKAAKKQKLAASGGFVTLSMCIMKKSRRRYVKDGDYTEVRVRHDAVYSEVCESAAGLLGLSDESDSDESDGCGQQLTLFRANGTVVQDKPIALETEIHNVPWTIHSYLRTFSSFSRSGNPVKLGVGYTTARRKEKTAVTHSQHNQPDTGTPMHMGSGKGSKTDPRKGKGRRARVSSHQGSSRDPPPVAPRKSQEDSVTVYYAAEIGGLGLDIEDKLERVDVYQLENPGMDLTNALSLMDMSIPYQPEHSHYMVAEIRKGGKSFMTAAADATYTVYNDLTAQFRVVHQSDYEVTLRSGGGAVPLFCIASGHCIEYAYQWRVEGRRIGANSCVVWVNQPGLYSCHVRHHILAAECSSSLITVLPSTEVIAVPSGSDFHLPSTWTDSSGAVHKEEDVHITSQATPTGRRNQVELQQSTSHVAMVSGGVMKYKASELREATNNFDDKTHLIGKGGFGKVYRGILRTAHVAVKLLSEQGMQMLRAKTTTQLCTEVAALTRFRHPNIVPLMGFCEEQPALVLPLMKRFSLHKNLHRWKVTEPLTWKQRVSVCHDAASGLAYLHAAIPPVIHHDINSSNILLDENYVAKIADFGFSIQLPVIVGGKTLITATPGHGLPGTPGYMPPEYQHGKYSTFSDVFSYGVVVLEVFTGLMPYSTQRDECCLSDHCEDALADQEAFRRMGDKKAGFCPSNIAEHFRKVVKCCIPRSYKKRSSMADVLKMWEDLMMNKLPYVQPATSLT